MHGKKGETDVVSLDIGYCIQQYHEERESYYVDQMGIK